MKVLGVPYENVTACGGRFDAGGGVVAVGGLAPGPGPVHGVSVLWEVGDRVKG